ncbi:hypothetical protein AMATHDRAFT_77506 [Amanita thiersii Skay4041]|uniref:Ribosome recycling factor domain-containing protein n=1 Tax=Amanita thiersii Skay4041 TaxID=703135 RepID=A0A2A9N824_9AGAR|nr:hypothetical protein AMATHDRAFT_77506 [Amanita thiersii Skay4041]
MSLTLVHKSVSTSTLIPGSQQPLTSEASREEYARAETSMRTAVEWYRKECAAAESRANGRVTPNVLAPVRVKVSGNAREGVVESAGGGLGVRLEQVATVGVRDGTMLLVTVFDEHTLKQVEQAIYEAKIPNVVPQKQDSRTIKIPMPKPTVEARHAIYTAQQRKAEDIRVQIRKQHQTSIKKGKYEKRSIELTEFQKLADRYIADVDQILANLKKATGAK